MCFVEVVKKGSVWLHPVKFVVLCFCSIARMHLLWVFIHIYYCVCMGTSDSVDGVCLLQPHRVHMSCLSSCCRPKDIKGGACFLLRLSSSFGRGPYFRMPIWSAAVPRTSTFLPPPLPLFFPCWSLSESRTVLFSIFKLVATGEGTHSSLLASALWPVYRSDTQLWLFQVAWLQVEH